MKATSFSAIALAALLLAGCSGIKISGISKTPEFSISKYKSFGFHELEAGGSGLAANIQPNVDLLKAAIVKEMQAKGVTRTQSSPDLICNIGVVVEEKEQTRETSLTNPGDRQMTYMGSRNYSWESQEVVVGTYREGSVKVDLIDKNTMKLVWTGTAESVLPSKAKNVPATIDEAMQKLFAEMK